MQGSPPQQPVWIQWSSQNVQLNSVWIPLNQLSNYRYLWSLRKAAQRWIGILDMKQYLSSFVKPWFSCRCDLQDVIVRKQYLSVWPRNNHLNLLKCVCVCMCRLITEQVIDSEKKMSYNKQNILRDLLSNTKSIYLQIRTCLDTETTFSQWLP